MNDAAWIALALRSARPRALGALLRYFRDLDTAEEAFQDACLAALKNWAENGPPRDPAAWLIFVGRNAAVDDARHQRRQQPLPDDDQLAQAAGAAPRSGGGAGRPPGRRALSRRHPPVAVHLLPPGTAGDPQIALALRIVCGLSVKEIARAFLVGDSAMEQRITRAKSRVAGAEVPFETPGAPERAPRLAAVAAVIYLMFNEGYFATGGDAPSARRCATRRSAWRGCCCGYSPTSPR